MEEGMQIDRREMVKRTAGLLTGAIAAGSPLALLARGRAWAVDLRAFSSAEGAALAAVARTIAPHDQLEEVAYAMVVGAMDGDASGDPGTRKMYQEGLAGLGPGFAAASEEERVRALRKIEAGAFFAAARLKTLQVLYATPAAYAYFGYEGEAFSRGGYLYRGFDELRWLPDVPAEDSGPMPVRS